MYQRKLFIKIVLGFMAAVLLIGYPLSLLGGTPIFQGLLGNSTSTGPQATIDQATKDLHKYPYDPAHPKQHAANKSHYVQALKDLGAGYNALAAGDPQNGVNPPADADKDSEQARQAYERALAVTPDDQSAMIFLARSYAEAATNADGSTNVDMAKKAVALYQKLIKHPPDTATLSDLYLQLGVNAQTAKENTIAVSAFRTFLKLSPDDQYAAQVKQAIQQILHPSTSPTVSAPTAK